MYLVPADNFETVKKKYIDVIENTPEINQHARWIYGKHPTDEQLKTYIERGEMYLLMDHEEIAGMAAIVMSQGEDYEAISWQDDLGNDQVVTVHLLAVCPEYRGRSLGNRILEAAMNIGMRQGKRALRLDVLKSNLPAQRMYEKAGFSYRGEQELYAENTGMTEFLFFEKPLPLILETERLFLREMSMEDFDALYAVLGDPYIMQHYPCTFDEKRVRGWIERNMERYRKDGFGLWAVCLKETGEVIGDCGLTLQNIDGNMLPEIGFHIRRDCQHKGYAKESAAAVRDWAFQNTGYPALYSYCRKTNAASVKTAEAIGMHFDREYPDEANVITHVSVVRRDEFYEKPMIPKEEYIRNVNGG